MEATTRRAWRSWLRRRWPTLVVVAGVLGMHAPGALRGAWFVHRDSLEYTYATDHVLRQAAAAGRLPHLNPWILGSVPHLADPPTQALYPPRWLTLPWSQPTATHLFVIGHALLAGLGAAALARGLAAGQAGQALAGVVYPASGYVMSMQENLPLLAGAAWTPWALASAIRVGRRGARRAALRPAAGLALAIGACALAGDPQAAAVAGALAPLLALAAAAPGRRASAGGVAAVSTALGVLLAGAVLVPAAALAPVTTRSIDFPYAVASLWSTNPWRAVEALVPWPWAADFPTLRFAGRRLLEGDRTSFFAETLYVGPLVLLLAAAGLGRGGSPRAGRVLALAAVGSALLALGRHTPLHEWAFAALPGLARLRYPEKFMLLPTLAACALAGRGATSLRAGPARPGAVALGVGAAALLLVPSLVRPLIEASATAPWDAPIIREQLHDGAARAGLVLGLAGAALVIAARAARSAATPAERRRRLAWGAAAALLAAGLDPLVAHRARRFLADASPFEPPPPATLRARAALAPAAPDGVPGRLTLWPPGLSAPAGAPGEAAEVALRRAVERGAAAYRFDVRVLQGFASWHPRRLGAFVSADPTRPERAWGLLAVQRALSAAGGAPPPGADPSRPDAVAVGPVALHELPPPAPVAWLVPRDATAAADDQAQALDLVGRPGFDPARHTVLEGAPAEVAPLALGSAWPRANADRPGEAVARWPGPAAGELEVLVRTSSPATLLVADLHVPGWEATVDGVAAALYPASGLVLGVPLPPGEHRVRLRFRTPGLAAGLALSSLAALALGGAFVLGRRRPAGPRSPDPAHLPGARRPSLGQNQENDVTGRP